MKAEQRYAVLDEYTMRELRIKYEGADGRGRIALLKMLQRTHAGGGLTAPQELKVLAAQDPDVRVRRWFALNEEYFPDNIRFLIRQDPDGMVAAARFENPNFTDLSWDYEEKFQSATTSLERLAFVRNPKLSINFIERLLDPDNQDLNLDFAARYELILACLTNTEPFRWWFGPRWIEHPKGGREYFIQFWEFAQKWALDSRGECQRIASRLLDVIGYDSDPSARTLGETNALHFRREQKDQIKAKAYSAFESAYLRLGIIDGCSRWDTATLALGRTDDDAYCRNTARSKSPAPKSPSIVDRLKNPPWQWDIVYRSLLLSAMIFMWSKSSSDFEQIVVVALALVYLAIISGLMWARANAQVFHLWQYEQAKRIGELAGESISVDEEAESQAEMEALSQQTAGRTLVDSVFWVVTIVLCAVVLIHTAL